MREAVEDEPMDCTMSGNTTAAITSEKADESMVTESESEVKTIDDVPMENM